MTPGIFQVRTLAATFAASRSEIFATLADVEALPRWASQFCERVDLWPHGWRALTNSGEWFAEVEADERTGVVDLKFFDGEQCRWVLPLRVVSLPGGQVLVSAVLAQWPELDDVTFERDVEIWRAALQALPEASRIRRLPGFPALRAV